MILAHFSDLHLRPGQPEELERALALVDHATARGAEHLLFGGDILDCANLAEARALAAGLAARGLLSPGRLSLVPGNHDAWPYGATSLRRDVLKALVTFRAFHRGLRTQALARTFAPALEGTSRARPHDPWPCLKRVGPVAIALLDTSSDDPRAPVRGRFLPEDALALERELARHEGPRLLLMHHPPLDLGWGRYVAGSVPPRVRAALARLGVPLERVAESSLEDVEGAQRWIARVGFDAVLCGHAHGGLRFSVGAIPVHGMGRSGGHGGSQAYDLVEVGRRVRVETVYVRRRELVSSTKLEARERPPAGDARGPQGGEDRDDLAVET